LAIVLTGIVKVSVTVVYFVTLLSTLAAQGEKKINIKVSVLQSRGCFFLMIEILKNVGLLPCKCSSFCFIVNI
jgi:hypothetical protein